MPSACVCQEAALAAYPVSPRMCGDPLGMCESPLKTESQSQRDAKRKLTIADFFCKYTV